MSSSSTIPIIDNVISEGAPEDASQGKAAGDQEQEPEHHEPGSVGIAGLGVGRHWGRTGRAKLVARGAAVNSMLEGYYPIVRRAVAVALIGRVTAVSFVAVYLWKKYSDRLVQ